MTNTDRAQNASEALAAYADATRANPNDREWDEILRDLLGDLMHYASQRGIDFEQELEWARGNHSDECEEESD